MMNEGAEKYIILLLGVKDKPIPSMWHLQKEMFMLSRAIPKINEFFDFEMHYNGPFSSSLKEIIDAPLYYVNSHHVHKNGTISLTKNGTDIFKKIMAEHHNKRFTDLVKTVSLTREIYDKLEKDELLFLIYQTYPKYIEHSDIYERLIANRKALADSLLAKGMITNKRHNELKMIEQ